MKRAIALVLILAVGIAVTAVADEHGDEVAWFDMENCDFCKHFLVDAKLLDNMTWECHDIANGMVSISTVDPEYKDSYKKAQAAMIELGTKLEKGELQVADVKMCGHCMAYGGLMDAGAKFEYIMGEAADVTIITSDDPAIVEKIKGFAETNRIEHAKWEAAEEMK